jgi:hypothetical protein
VPTTPVLQVALTMSGPETRNIGAATTGKDKRPSKEEGKGMGISVDYS